jgi:3-deoxy-manno-octulosonate cytidylyltransferase (CMP-KDO synthetase)
MKVMGIIPARYASTRFMGKPLVDIGGKSMIQRVYEKAKSTACLHSVIVATDDERIYMHVQKFGGQVMMTASHHQSGTDRCAEVAASLDCEAVVNIQGDEPFIDPTQIEKVVAILRGPTFGIATLAKCIDNNADIHNPNIVKVVFNEQKQALYFSRSPIPFLRNIPLDEWYMHQKHYKHLGIYGYKTNILKEIAHLKTGHLEALESLEQLRWLENGYTIGIGLTDIETIGIDTPEDLEKVKNYILEP